MKDILEFIHLLEHGFSMAVKSRSVIGYLFDGFDGSQLAHWTFVEDAVSEEHAHDFDEYYVVLQGEYALLLNNQSISIRSGEEIFIPAGTPHSGTLYAGSRVLHAFGGLHYE